MSCLVLLIVTFFKSDICGNIVQVICEPNGDNPGKFVGEVIFWQLVVALFVTLEIRVWIVSAVLSWVVFQETVLLDSYRVNVPSPRVWIDWVSRREEGVVTDLPPCVQFFPLHQHLQGPVLQRHLNDNSFQALLLDQGVFAYVKGVAVVGVADPLQLEVLLYVYGQPLIRERVNWYLTDLVQN